MSLPTHLSGLPTATDPAETVRQLVLSEIDPTQGVCLVAATHLVDAPPATPPTPDDVRPVEVDGDVLELVESAMNHGEAPIGPIEYVQGTIEYGLRSEAPVATSISMAGDVCELHLALALGPDGWMAVGGSRYGHLPHCDPPRPPASLLLPDVEATLAEAVIYTRWRSRQLGYHGPVRIELDAVHPAPLLLCAVDPTSGRTTDGTPRDGIPTVVFEYDTDLSRADLSARLYEQGRQIAAAFGVDEPQWFTPDGHDGS